MTVRAVVGINCDYYTHPAPPAVVQARHWLGWLPDGNYAIGPAESTSTDHADCGKLATASVFAGRMLPIVDNATADQIAAAVNAAGGHASISYAPITDLIPGAASARVYNCWPAQVQTVDLATSHNPQMGTVLITEEDNDVILVRNTDDGAIYRLGDNGLRHLTPGEYKLYQAAGVTVQSTTTAGLSGIPVAGSGTPGCGFTAANAADIADIRKHVDADLH